MINVDSESIPVYELNLTEQLKRFEILSFHGGGYEECRLLGCGAM
jgi:hypothetical protein